MSHLKEMHPAGAVVIVIILALFAASIALLFYVTARYKKLQNSIGEDAEENDFLSYTLHEYRSAYRQFGEDVNTPAVITDCMGVRLSGLLFAERYLNNAVSLFVTLGLFGTFLGLSLSVTALTQLISYSNTSEWLSVLDSVGGGLMSALSGMGVAFYTSLVGAGCSILLTLLRTVFSPQSRRDQLATTLELWLDHDVAPTLVTDRAKSDEQLIHQMIGSMDKTASAMEKTLQTASAGILKATETASAGLLRTTEAASAGLLKTTDAAASGLQKSMDTASAGLQKTVDGAATGLRETLEGSRPYLVAFHQTVEKFNNGVRDFGEVDYNLRGTVERLDVAVRDLTRALQQAARTADNKENER